MRSSLLLFRYQTFSPLKSICSVCPKCMWHQPAFLAFSSIPAWWESGLQARGFPGLFPNRAEKSINVPCLKRLQARVSQVTVTVPTFPVKLHTFKNPVHVAVISINQRAFLETRSQELIKIYSIYASKKWRKEVRSKKVWYLQTGPIQKRVYCLIGQVKQDTIRANLVPEDS